MKGPTLTSLAAIAVMLAPAHAPAQPNSPRPGPQPNAPAAVEPARGPTANTIDLLDKVAASSGLEFVLDPRVTPQMPIGNASIQNLSFTELQAILRVNGYFTVEIDDRIFVMPASQSRQAPTRLLNRDDPSVSDHEIVTRVIRVRGEEQRITDPQGNEHTVGPAAALVPVLRPMQPVEAHLAAAGNYLIIVDRYDNVRRITEIVDALTR
jgi:type II secretory pathway component GspD/PulD (secretin)